MMILVHDQTKRVTTTFWSIKQALRFGIILASLNREVQYEILSLRTITWGDL